jgi:hypothetical protein
LRIGADGELYFIWVAAASLPATHPAVQAAEWVFCHLNELEPHIEVEVSAETASVNAIERRMIYRSA